MTDEEIRKRIESGIERSEIEFIMGHSEIGKDFQYQLISLYAKGDMAMYYGAIDELILRDIWDERKDEPNPKLEKEASEAIDYIMSLDEPPKELPIQMQYLNNTLVLRKLFYYDGNLLADVVPGKKDCAGFETMRGEQWDVDFWSDSNLTIDKSLDPFDVAVLDVIYTLYCNEIKAFSTKWIDLLLSGNMKRNPTGNSIARIDRTIDKLSAIHVQCTLNGVPREQTPLLSLSKFGHSQGNIYYLRQINDLYAYAHDKKQISNIPNRYFDTSKLPKEYSFADTETAMVIKRRVVLRVMRILTISSGKASFANWNRISLIQKKDKSEGLFPELGLMPDVENLEPVEAEKKLKQWRTKQKPLYIKVVRGTLENLKRQYVVLDYEEHKDNDSKNPKDPVTGFDIICFTKSERAALSKLRDEQKPQYVMNLLSKRQKQ